MMIAADNTVNKLVLGVSQCLMGDAVRYNGGHKHSKILTQELGKVFDFHPLCPEVAIGLGVPRQPIRLVDSGSEVRVVGIDDPKHDVTERLWEYGNEKGANLNQLAGFVFMQNSPSCGLFNVKTYLENGYPSGRSHLGMFAKAFCHQQPLLPVEEAGRLNDPALRENFITRVFVYQQWRKKVENNLSRKAVIEFYSNQKFLLLAHSQSRYRELGKFVASAGDKDEKAFAQSVIQEIMQILTIVASRKNHTNVLMHLQGFVKQVIESRDRQELQQVILQYNRGEVPLLAPLVLLRHHISKAGNDYLSQQSYLSPHPVELGLRKNL